MLAPLLCIQVGTWWIGFQIHISSALARLPCPTCQLVDQAKATSRFLTKPKNPSINYTLQSISVSILIPHLLYQGLWITFKNKLDKYEKDHGLWVGIRSTAPTKEPKRECYVLILACSIFSKEQTKYPAWINSNAMLDWLMHCGRSRDNQVNLQSINSALK